MSDARSPRRWTVDATHWPVVVMRIVGPGAELPDEESLYQMGDLLVSVPALRVFLLDLSGSTPDAKRRQRVVAWGKSNIDGIAAVTTAVALVTPSSLQRGLLTAITWVIELPMPVQSFPTYAEALVWAEDRARMDGLSGPVPEALVPYA